MVHIFLVPRAACHFLSMADHYVGNRAADRQWGPRASAPAYQSRRRPAPSHPAPSTRRSAL